MSRLKNNPDINLDRLHLTKVSFNVLKERGFIEFVVINNETNVIGTFEVMGNVWRKETTGIMYDNNFIKIEAEKYKRHHRHLLDSMLDKRVYRSANRIISLNKKKIGTLEISSGVRSGFGVTSLPLHHELKNWDTLYYDHTTLDVQIYYRGSIFAVAKYYDGTYRMMITKDEYLPLCTLLALAAIDSKDNNVGIE